MNSSNQTPENFIQRVSSTLKKTFRLFREMSSVGVDEIICIYFTYDPEDAVAVRSQLEEAGIPNNLRWNFQPGIRPVGRTRYNEAIKVLIRKVDEKAAIEVIDGTGTICQTADDSSSMEESG